MGTALYNILIKPIELFIEVVFNVMNLAFKSPGIAIIFVSIAIQLLCFPLYKRADVIQEQERQKQKDMKYWLDHIKKTFKGDERFMMQQTYYRLQDYKPIYAIKSSVSLLLQIPFFIAAYNFLSNLDALKHSSFFGIADLSQPDQLIHIGSLSLNLLPILMTLFNIVSGIIYTKGFPLKDKIQTYGLACIFLVILYNSPSGLVFYWTLNNVFSLVKNIFMKLVKNPKKIITLILLAMGVITVMYAVFFSRRSVMFKSLFIFLGVICILPSIITKIRSSISSDKSSASINTINIKTVNSVFYTGISTVFILLALVIPVSVVKSSPAEFVSMNYGPFGLIFRVACIFAGLIYVWINIFYIFSTPKTKKIFSVAASIIAIVFPINYFLFAKNLGIVSQYLVYVHYPSFSVNQMLVNILAVVAAVITVLILCLKKTGLVKKLYQIAVITFAVTAAVGLVSVEKKLAYEGHPEKQKTSESASINNEQIIHLSKNGKNVVVLMLDRALSGYMPYILEEKPEIKEIYDGFTYYPNTISYGGSTNIASPALFGGYEYTPIELNKRDSEALVDKHNEALTVLPKLMLDNGYKVTVLDPPYAGYKLNPDLSIYDKYEKIKAYNTIGVYSQEFKMQYSPLYEASQVRNFVFYSIMKSMPVATQNIIYQNGVYWSTGTFAPTIVSFLDSYTVLEKLGSLTDISEEGGNTFLMMENRTTHEPMLLNEEDYTPSVEAQMPSESTKKDSDGNLLDLSNLDNMRHYHSNMAAVLKVGEWLKYLKENGVYDNTRIIIVSDHGFNLGQFEEMKLSNGVNVEAFNPLFLVKDFNSSGFNISDEFMTNADTPTLAIKDIIDNPVNPFTGKALNNFEKAAYAPIITTSVNSDVSLSNGNKLYTDDGEWWSVSKNIFDEKNWKKADVN